MEAPLPVTPQEEPQSPRSYLALALAANVLTFLLPIKFYSVEPGSSIRPMVWSAEIYIIAVAGLAPFLVALGEIWNNPRRVWFWLTAVLSLTPYPLAILMVRHAMSLRGFQLSP